MKRLLLFAMLAFMWVSNCVSQVKIESSEINQETLDYTIVVSCPQGKDVLYRAAKEWLSTNLKNFQQNLQYDDRESGTIKVKMTSYLSSKKTLHGYDVSMVGHYEYVTTVTVKDGKFRVKTDNLMAYWTESMVYGMKKENIGNKRLEGVGFLKWSGDSNALEFYANDIGNLIGGIGKQAQTQEKDDDF